MSASPQSGQVLRSDGLPTIPLREGSTPKRKSTYTPATSTPHRHKTSASVVHESLPATRDVRHRVLGEEGKGSFVGPMPVQMFLDSFMPQDSQKKPISEKLRTDIKNGLADVAQSSGEKIKGRKLVPLLDMIADRLKAFDTSNNQTLSCTHKRPDVSLYDRTPTLPPSAPPFDEMSLWIELKSKSEGDPFIDNPTSTTDTGRRQMSFVRDTEKAYTNLGQMMMYANGQYCTQFRTFIFSVVMCGRIARFVRWDRAGAIVTEAFEYGKHPDLFIEFFSRYNHMTHFNRGYDGTVSTPSENDAAAARLALNGSATHTEPLLQLMVPHADEGALTYHRCVINRPQFKLDSPFGRGSRAFPAYSLERKALVYLKDYWRYTEEGIQKESTTYKELNVAEVPHVPTLDHGGDLGYHTITQLYLKFPWVCWTDHLFKHSAFRMTLLECGRDLEDFDRSRDYVKAIRDAMEAHWFAYDKLHILHRDISLGNILLTQTGNGGLLIDWEFAKKMMKTPHGDMPRRKYRTGTWQFIAAMVLLNTDYAHDYLDDLESFFWVLLYVSLTQTPSNLSPSALALELCQFDETFEVDGMSRGGSAKEASLARAFRHLSFKDRPMLETLVCEVSSMFNHRYLLPNPALFQEYEKRRAENPTARLVEPPAHLTTTEVWQFAALQGVVDARKQMTSASHFLSLLDTALDSDLWPASDGHKRQAIHNPRVPMTNLKRSSQSLQKERESGSKRTRLDAGLSGSKLSRNWTVPEPEPAEDDSSTETACLPILETLESDAENPFDDELSAPPITCGCVTCQHVTDDLEPADLGLGSFWAAPLVENFTVLG